MLFLYIIEKKINNWFEKKDQNKLEEKDFLIPISLQSNFVRLDISNYEFCQIK